nr:uncharacterized protein LOC115267467 [Aedes albopictus]
MVECSLCGGNVLPSDLPLCCSGCGCAKVVHYKCTSLTKAVAKVITENENVAFKCDECLSSQCCGEQNVLLSNAQKFEEEMKKISSLADSLSGVREHIAAQINETMKCDIEQLGRNLNCTLEKAIFGLGELVNKEMENMKCSFSQFNSGKAAMNVRQGTSSTASEPNSNPRGKKRRVQDDGADTSDDVFIEKVSFADIVKNNSGNQTNGKISRKKSVKSNDANVTKKVEVTRKARPVIVIKPQESSQSSDDTRKFLYTKLDPKIHKISNFRNGKDGSIIAECATGYNVNVVKDGIQSELGENYKAVVPSSVPRLKVMGMCDQFSSDEFIQILKDQNEDIAINEVKVIRMFENPRFKYNKYNAVIEVDKNTYSCMLTARKVNIRFDRCLVVPDNSIVRCFECGEFGHVSTNCKNGTKCSKCSESHKSSECTSTVLKCVNCCKMNNERKLNLDVNHAAFNVSECEVYKRLVQRKKSSLHLNE